VSETCRITVDGRPVECRPGTTIAAALIAAGIDSWRTTRRGGDRRGLFCGIGVCFDCLVSVDGGPPVRACLAPVRPGDRIRTVPVNRPADD
jgi:NADH dehydrogenase/NADH:ubiquinone oxidoreductase subunit G